MLLELEKRSLIDKYTSSTVIGNVFKQAKKYPTLYRNNIINAAVLSMLNTTGNLRLIQIADTINIDLEDFDLYQLDVLSNIDSVFTTLRIIYLDKRYSSNYDDYSILYSTTFEFASGPTMLDKNNFFQVWWHVGKTVVENDTVVFNELYSHRYSQNPYDKKISLYIYIYILNFYIYFLFSLTYFSFCTDVNVILPKIHQ